VEVQVALGLSRLEPAANASTQAQNCARISQN
jgi:hypothetical protein